MPADYPYARAQEQDLQDEDTGAGCERRRTAEEWPRRGRRAALERRRRGAWVRPSIATDVGPGHRRRGAWARPALALGCGVEPHRRGGLGTAVSCRRRGCLGEEERRPMGGDSGSHEGAEGDWATADWGWRPRGVEVERSGGNE